jgi:glyoxalase/bleomycin resistance protein/dioxygenase superfamily protein
MPTAPPFDALASADFLVPDRDAAVDMVQRVVGLGAPKPRWSHGGRGAGHRVTFCRANPKFAASPTLIELIEATDVDPARSITDVVPNVGGLAALQGDRPLKTHGAPVASSSVGELVERARSRGVRHWVQPSNDTYPFERLWMGITADDLSGYRPDTDGGLMIEVVPTPTLMLPTDAAEAPADAADAVAPGSMVRTASRGFLVDDLDRSLDALVDFFGWEPERGPEIGDGGARRAVLGFRVPRSARIELLAPAPDTEEGRFLARWGQGIWHVRIAVADLDAQADDLRARGTPFREVRTGFADPEVVLRIDPDATPACLFEFCPVG